MDIFHHKHGGIHLVVIDGIADLIRSANDETESVAIVDELYRLAGIITLALSASFILCLAGLSSEGILVSSYSVRQQVSSLLRKMITLNTRLSRP